MKVAFISFWYPHKYNRQFCPFVQEHARAIHKSGIEIVVFAFHFLPSKYWFKKFIEIEIDSFGFETHHIYIESAFHKWIYINPFHCYWFVNNYFKNIHTTFKPDIIHSNIVGVCAISGYFLAKKYKLKHIITEHWTRVNQYFKNNKLSFLGRIAYNKAHAITVVSDFLKSVVSKYVSDTSKIHVVPNIIPDQIFIYAPKPELSKELVFCSIGHLKKPKLPMLMVRAVDEFSKQSSLKIVFYMFGEGEERKEIEKLIPNLHYTLHLMGLQSKNIIAVTLHKTTIFLHASTYETFCVAIGEALCTGTPVLASNNTAITELVNNENGILVDNELEKWCVSLHRITTNSYNHLAIANRFGNRLSYDSIGESFLKIYKL